MAVTRAWVVGLLWCLGCTLDSGDTAIADAASEEASAPDATDFGACLATVPVNALRDLGTQCATCACTAPESRQLVTDCGVSCWALIVCAHDFCPMSANPSEQLNCLSSICIPMIPDFSTAVGPAMALQPVLTGCACGL